MRSPLHRSLVLTGNYYHESIESGLVGKKFYCSSDTQSRKVDIAHPTDSISNLKLSQVRDRNTVVSAPIGRT
jgi:hypothetical protein